jgi:hypothetical protein
MTAALNAYVNGMWTPVDLKGPQGAAGPAGAAGTFTWPASNYQNFTNNRSAIGDGIIEPGPWTAVNAGSNPCTKVNAGNTSRVEVLRSGIMFATAIFACAAVMQQVSWFNIRKQPADLVLASWTMCPGETDGECSAVFPVTTGDLLSFPWYKVSSGSHNLSFVVRTGLLV